VSLSSHCNENPIYVNPEKEFRDLSPNFHIHVSISNLSIPRISPHIFLQKNRQTNLGIYKSLTDSWTWKLGLRLRKSLSGNICFKFWVLCLCSAVVLICRGRLKILLGGVGQRTLSKAFSTFVEKHIQMSSFIFRPVCGGEDEYVVGARDIHR
jgi:hypothetical protein